MILSMGFQAKVFLISFLCGAAFSAYYDVFRLFRIYKRHSSVLIDLEDAVYWILCAFLFFTIILKINNGEMRFYIPVAFFSGIILYFLTLGKLVMRAAQKIINIFIYIVKLFIEIILTPFKLVWAVLKKPAMFFCNLMSKVLISKLKCAKMLIKPGDKLKKIKSAKQKGKETQCREKKQGKKKNHFLTYW
ncbi:spore cortex biosynthesis protein YabQ [Lachnospiraceae bacterium NSJ-143]|nr:spore cortex biosynthesis protein YabQ [Lachnospiraceae bacterium NSJ-143]